MVRQSLLSSKPMPAVTEKNVLEKRTVWKKLLLSIIVVGSVACTWALSTQFSQSALKIHPEHFNAPYGMMWFNTNFMLCCYPVYILFELTRRSNIRSAHDHAQTIFGSKGLTPFTLLIRVFPFLLFWIGANYTYTKALTFVSASVATSISSCNAAMVYFLAILILKDKFVPLKMLSVLFAVGGVVVISLGMKGGTGDEHWLGILLAVCSATSAAVYKVVFKRLLGSADLGQVSLFMSCLGFLNLTLNWIPPLVLSLTGAELIEWNWVPWAPMCGAALLSLLFNFLINFGIALLHPLVISVGMLLGIPLNMTIDIVFRDVSASAYFLGGTALIAISFLLIIFPYDMVCEKKEEEKEREKEMIERL